MMTTKMTIVHESGLYNTIIVTNPQHIPRVGDKIDMNITPFPRVTRVLWDYKNPNQTNIYIIVE